MIFVEHFSYRLSLTKSSMVSCFFCKRLSKSAIFFSYSSLTKFCSDSLSFNLLTKIKSLFFKVKIQVKLLLLLLILILLLILLLLLLLLLILLLLLLLLLLLILLLLQLMILLLLLLILLLLLLLLLQSINQKIKILLLRNIT